MEQCDDQIEQFKADLEEAGPEQKEKYDEEISVLIANREAVRRGLLRVTPEGDGFLRHGEVSRRSLKCSNGRIMWPSVW